ncbi:MAG TPA: hypothetical protein PKA98_23415, partial [Acidimicrobiales bacterium]|nr:hypothetical protein [Acidimicrobiales bacterium]
MAVGTAGDRARFGGLPALRALVGELTRPRLYAVDPDTLLEIPPSPALAELLPEHFPFLVADIVPEDQALAVTCYQQASRTGLGQVLVRFGDAAEPTLMTIADVAADTGAFAYVFSDDPHALAATASAEVSPATEASSSVVLTPGGKITEIYGSIPGVLHEDDPEVVGSSLAAAVHPDDLPDALNAFAGVLQDH